MRFDGFSTPVISLWLICTTLCLWCLQKLPASQSLHVLFCCWCSQMLLPPQSLHLLFCLWCSHSAGAFRGFLAAAGCHARPNALDVFTPRSSCLLHFPCGPQGEFPSSILFLPASAASRPSVGSNILCDVSSMCYQARSVAERQGSQESI